jgi:copper(I)-binding protein
VLLALALLITVTTGCAGAQREQSMAAGVTVRDQWASAADTGMAAVFGTFANNGHHEARIVSATSPVAGRMEVHEVSADASGTKTMHPKAGGIVIPPGETHELVPGGDHLMLMDLTAPLTPGADVPVTVTFEDGSTLDITAQIRDFAGANENYHPHG